MLGGALLGGGGLGGECAKLLTQRLIGTFQLGLVFHALAVRVTGSRAAGQQPPHGQSTHQGQDDGHYRRRVHGSIVVQGCDTFPSHSLALSGSCSMTLANCAG